MGKPYSDDLRERVIAAIEAGHTREEVAELFNMALSTVGGFIKRKRETGSVSPDKFGGYKTFSLEPHTYLVMELVAEQPDSTLAELQARLKKQKVKVSQSGISRFLHHIKLTFKKRVYTQPNKIGPTSPRPVRRCGKNSQPSGSGHFRGNDDVGDKSGVPPIATELVHGRERRRKRQAAAPACWCGRRDSNPHGVTP